MSFKIRYAFALSLLVAGMITAQAADKQKFKTPVYGKIRVTTTPTGATVKINGVEKGITGASRDQYFESENLTPGVYDVEVIFPSGKVYPRTVNLGAGKRECICLALRRTTTVIPKICPEQINLQAPTTVNEGDIVTFVADVPNDTGADGRAPFNYVWGVNSGARIMSGQGTRSITVDTRGLGNQQLTARVDVSDGTGDPACWASAEIALPVIAIPPIEARLTDEFPRTNFDDDKARLDNFVVQLQNAPDSTAVVYIYGGRGSRPGSVERLIERTRDYLINTRGLSAARLTVANGGYRETEYMQLWLIPAGAQMPQASPTLSPADAVQPVRRSRRRGRG